MSRLLVFAPLLLTSCGLAIPTDDALRCGGSVYVQHQARISCEDAFAWVGRAGTVVGTDLSPATIEFMRGDDLSSLGRQDLIGWTRGGDVAIVATRAAVLVHEAFHWRDGQWNHCDWSAPERLAVFTEQRVPGNFTDECAHVTCEDAALSGTGWSCR